jgi:arylsulfatase A-like enzyme
MHASLFTGLYPEAHGVNWAHYALDDRAPVLAELVQQQGYDTFAISNNWLLNEANGFARGFHAFIETSKDPLLSQWRFALRCAAPRTLVESLGLTADVGFDAGSTLTNWLMRKRLAAQAQSGRPFLAFVNYFEPHDPYLPLKRFRTRFLTAQEQRTARKITQSETLLAAQACGLPGILTDARIALLSKLYDAEVAYQDEMIGELVEVLKHHALLDDTWLIVMSDHGELFGEWGMVYHTAGAHYRLLHIPLIVRPPGGVSGRRIDALVQPVDVFVTLLEIAGARLPSPARGAYRLPLHEDAPAERTICIAQTHAASIAGLSISQRLDQGADLAHWLTWLTSVCTDAYLLELDSEGPHGLYAIGSDPEMSRNLINQETEVANTILGQFRDWSSDVCGRPCAYADDIR